MGMALDLATSGVLKRCSWCGRKKSTGEFWSNTGTKDELDSWCKGCRRVVREGGKVDRSNWKRCGKCRKKKGRDEFAKSRVAKDGRQTWCRACMKVHQAGKKVKARRTWRVEDGVEVAEQRCSHCKETLPASEFYKSNFKRNGLQDRCKECGRQAVQDHYWRRGREVKKRRYANRRRAYYLAHKVNPEELVKRWGRGEKVGPPKDWIVDEREALILGLVKPRKGKGRK